VWRLRLSALRRLQRHGLQCKCLWPLDDIFIAHIHQECRYHITYLSHLACCIDDPSHCESHEADFADDIDSVRRCHHHCDECMSGPIHELACKDKNCANRGSGPEFHSGNFPIESIRAAHLAGEPRERRYCADCKPHLCDEEGPVLEYVLDIINEHKGSGDWCCCGLVDKFVDGSWLCIPCFIKQETEAYSRRIKKDDFKWEKDADGSRKLVGTQVRFL
jgi:hypothetical protein